MNTVIKPFLLLCSLFFALTSFAETGETMQQFGDYQVHYNVFNTTFLTPEIASEYGIVRSKKTALMNISVLKKQADGTYKGVLAKVSGDHFDLVKKEVLKFQEVREENAVYYLSSFDIVHRIDVYFTVNVQVEGEPSVFTVKFQKRLYRDE